MGCPVKKGAVSPLSVWKRPASRQDHRWAWKGLRKESFLTCPGRRGCAISSQWPPRPPPWQASWWQHLSPSQKAPSHTRRSAARSSIPDAHTANVTQRSPGTVLLYAGQQADLKETREHVGWLASDDKKAGVEFPELSIQILETLEEKPEEKDDKGRDIKSSVWGSCSNSAPCL